jgi:hypothetical protein
MQVVVLSPSMRRRRLEDRIRELCTRATTAREPELTTVLGELQGAIHEHVERIRKMAANQMIGPATQLPTPRSQRGNQKNSK